MHDFTARPSAARMLGALLAIAAWAPAAMAAEPATRTEAKSPYRTELIEESKSEPLCHKLPDHIFVRHKLGTACIAYIATRPIESRRAIVFFDGDTKPEDYLDTERRARNIAGLKNYMQAVADKLSVRIVRVARLGLDGSSGNHVDRRKPDEIHAMNAAVDVLKERLGFDDVILAGQSRGSLVAASLLTLGRKDVACAVLGSGVFEHARFIHAAASKANPKLKLSTVEKAVYDPSTRIGAIATDQRRRIFVVGDPDDAQVPFDQQERFAHSVGKAGHHARLHRIDAFDEKQHGAVRYVLPLAAHCARNADDERIATAITRIRDSLAKAAADKARAANASVEDKSQRAGL